MYKIAYHPFVIRFSPHTTIDEAIDNDPVINLQKFMLRKFDHLQALANTNLELPDVVGKIQSVQGSDLKDAGVMTRVVVCFIIALSVVVYMSLWDDAQQCLGMSSTQGICTSTPLQQRNFISTPIFQLLQSSQLAWNVQSGCLSMYQYQGWGKKEGICLNWRSKKNSFPTSNTDSAGAKEGVQRPRE